MTTTSRQRDMQPKSTRLRGSYKGNSRGMTLVELMVALAIGLVIALAAVAALTATRRGYATVDAASQLRDNGRFSSDLIQRIAVQTGFKDTYFAMVPASQADKTNDAAGLIAANITGFNNSIIDTTDLTNATARTTGSLGYGSDILILRYQAAKLNDGATSPADGSMIDCTGNAVTAAPIDRNDRVVSVFHVSVGIDGEPTLMCSRSSTGLAPFNSQPIISGVENFQVLYGVDGFGAADTAGTAFTGALDSVPQKYLRADQIVVAGNTSSKATYDNWRRVRSIRIGMVLRGPIGSQQEIVSQTFYPFGLAPNSSTGSAGTALSDSTNDPGTVFTPAADGRLRQVVTFTIHLRNDQSL